MGMVVANVCIYTANYGGYDAPREQAAQDIDVDWHYFTDSITPPGAWNLCHSQPPASTPMMQAKWWKMHPPVGYEYAIWIDANMEVTSPSFAREAIEALRPPHDDTKYETHWSEWLDHDRTFAVWKHPRRDCIYEEIVAAMGAERQGNKYDDVRLSEQGRSYYADGYPRHNGLYACGTVVWTPEAWPVGRAWWDECCEWTPQDQVSLPYVCWKLNTRPAVFPVPQLPDRFNRRLHRFENRWLNIYAHA